jgi:hypothetical protein
MIPKLLLALIGFSYCLVSTAQEKSPVKFGKVTPEDFKRTVYNIDSNANAVIIAEIGSTEIVGNNKGFFSQLFKHYKRAHILNKNGYDEANVEIYLYEEGDMEVELEGLKAVTYNLENGKVVETKLDKSSIFKDKIDKYNSVRKFTFPNIKEGSIIEFEYSTKSDFLFNLTSWIFQGQYPCLWSEYEVSIPDFYNYVFLTQGYQPYYIKDRKTRQTTFFIRDNSGTGASQQMDFRAGIVDTRMVMKDVPALKEESFTSTLGNHISRIDFQLSEERYPLRQRNVMGTWFTLSDRLLKSENFGVELTKNNNWLSDVYGSAMTDAKTELDKAKKIYGYVRDNFTCTDHSDIYMNQNLRNIVKTRNGSVADLNLLLIAMLKHEGLKADPVILSTRKHGYTYPIYPILSKFNYVIAKVDIDGKSYYLDASYPRLGFGKLGYECYNGHARIVNETATPIDFVADSIIERKVTSVFVINDEKGNMAGSMQQTPGYYESNTIRNTVKEKGKEQVFGDIKKAFTGEVELSEEGIDSLLRLEDPVNVHYKFEMKGDKENIIYFNPMFNEGMKDNPFKAAERFYPVEMPYAIDETYLLRMDVPVGYVVDELPKQMVVRLNEQDDGMFEYRISQSGETISMRSRIRIKRTFFSPEEYDMLREFFSHVVKKHAEQIVFKKK